jgi:Capsule polysaccharide biosynthesis protein
VTKPVKVIAFEWNIPMLIEVLAELSSQHGWQTLYCVSKRTEALVKRHFPSAIYHDTHDARYGRPAPELADLPWTSLDQPGAEALGYAQVTALKQMDRLALMDGFSMHERMLHFHRLIAYWSQVLDRLQPDVLLMPTAPHVVYDYVAYQLARRRGIRTIMFEYVTTEGLLMAIDRFEDGLPPLTRRYRQLLAQPPAGPVQLSERMESYLARLGGSYEDAIPVWTRYIRDSSRALRAAQAKEAEERAKKKAQEEARYLSEVKARQDAPLDRLLRIVGLQRTAPVKPAVETQETPAAPVPATDGHYGGRFYAESEVPVELHQENIARRYDELAVAPDLSQPFVYVALHLQPERSTNPIGGVFDEQYVMIGMISSVLPPGWRIYVKEHPSQLAPQFVSERGRWTSLYETLVPIPNVVLAARETPSFDLIDNARAVATITGTSSWEAIVRRVPTLVFGEPWYKGCPGSYTVRTADDCRQALTRIAAGERPDPAATRLFVKAAEQASFVGYLSSDEAELTGIDEATNVQRFVRAIVDCFADNTIASDEALSREVAN